MMIITLGLVPLPPAVAPCSRGIEAERKSQRLFPLHHRLKRGRGSVGGGGGGEKRGRGRERGIPPEREREREIETQNSCGGKGGRPRDLEISSLVFSLSDIYPFRSVMHGTMEEEGDARRR